jgi:type I restriction enzyme S subunit
MNVFAWEGAVAVAKPEDKGRYGSHRFITCVPRKDVITANFLCFYFLTEEGLEKLGEASPGGAGRNKTLGLTTLSKIQVPVPTMDKQQWFESLLFEADRLKTLQAQTAAELDALLPAILDRAFKGEL